MYFLYLCLCLSLEIYFKGLAPLNPCTVVQPGKSKICRAGQQAGDQGRSTAAILVSRQSGGGIPPF